ncbi:MAG: peptidoglycan recognition family protein [Planctomycetota bacterium]
MSTARTSQQPRSAYAGLSRNQIVTAALIGSMTLVGGLLWILDGGPRPDAAALRIPALVATTGPRSLDAIFETATPLDTRRWQGIVIHHSGSPHGSATTLDAEHRDMGLSKLGYHFVIGNGTGAGNGELHVGERWLDQAFGAHTAGEHGDWYNRNTIGICLVGDGDRRDFSPEQIQRLVALVNELQRRLDLPATSVKLHRELAETSSPGVRFPAATLRRQLVR